MIESYISINGESHTVMDALRKLFQNNPTGLQGIEELDEIISSTVALNVNTKLIVDPSLARGLNYYTGTIYEVKAIGVEMGSIGGGGRYDDLTGLFGVKGIAGVGISFGVDRIYDVMDELKLFPENIQQTSVALIFNTGIGNQKLLSVAQNLRSKGIACEIFHEKSKFDKQFKYAEKKLIPFAVIIGEEELQKDTALVKNLSTGQQTEFSIQQLHQAFKA